MRRFTKEEKKIIWEMAERCAGVAKGQKRGRWTHEDRVLIVYSVLCHLFSQNSEFLQSIDDKINRK